jgi:hypothetical protein
MKGVTNPAAGGDRLRSRATIFVALFGLLVPCSVAQTRPTWVAGRASPVQPASSSQRAANLTDVTSTLGIDFEYAASHTSRKYLIETMGSGVALFDYDNDGRLDIFMVNGAPLSDPAPKGTIPQKAGYKYWNRLYHQRRDGTFEDVTEKAGLQGTGYGMGVVTRSATIAISVASQRPVRLSVNGKTTSEAVQVPRKSFIRLLADY